MPVPGVAGTPGLGGDDFSRGQPGENFTVESPADDHVCTGDRHRIGEAVFEVTQPRVTCYRAGIPMGDPRMPALLVYHRRPGSASRVLRQGVLTPVVRRTPAPALEGVAGAGTPTAVSADTVLIRQGGQEMPTNAPAAGELNAMRGGHFLRRRGRGEGAGESALPRAPPRTVIAHTDATVYKLHPGSPS